MFSISWRVYCIFILGNSRVAPTQMRTTSVAHNFKSTKLGDGAHMASTCFLDGKKQNWVSKQVLSKNDIRYVYTYHMYIYISILYHVYIVRSNSKDIYHKKLTRLSQMFLVNHSILARSLVWWRSNFQR